MPKVVELKCNNCGAILNYDEDREILFCPYCGSKNLIVFSDNVKIEKIKSDKELEELRIKQEHEFKKKRYDERVYLGYLIFFIVLCIAWLIFIKILL